MIDNVGIDGGWLIQAIPIFDATMTLAIWTFKRASFERLLLLDDVYEFREWHYLRG